MRRVFEAAFLCAVLALVCGCGGATPGGGGGGGGGGGDPTTAPVTGTAADYTYSLTQASGGVRLWTTPTCAKVFPETARSPIPESTGDHLQLCAAANEFEPLQVVVWSPTDGACSVSLPSFGIGETVTLHSVEYVNVTRASDSSGTTGLWPDPLLPRAAGESIPLTAGRNRPLWITVRLPETAPPGDRTATLGLTIGGSTYRVPVRLHVFDFALPREIHLDSQMNYSHQALGGGSSLARVEQIKTFFHEHRMTPTGVAWPAGLNYNGGITYDCARETFDDRDGGAYSFSQLGPKYVDGVGWNGVGFPSFQAFQFTNNSTPRPDTFCGIARGDHYGTAAYNAKWQRMLAALDAYLVAHDYADKAYYYVMNEPQDQADYNLAAHLARLSRAAAPHLRLAISEEPKAEIFDNATYPGARYDLWIASIPHYDRDPETARERQAEHGEQVFWYSLWGDRPPYFNPITIDHRGLESRLLGFAAFGHRIDGYAYYSLTGWGDPWANPWLADNNGDGFLLYPERGSTSSPTRFIPSIRLELLREAFEDYEYLWIANGRRKPGAREASPVDAAVTSAVPSLTSWTKDSERFMDLRKELGRYIAGERTDVPVIGQEDPLRPRAAYFLNFQDPAGPPTANPLVVGGKTYLKIGWSAYDEARGYGWYGEHIGDDSIMLYRWLDDPSLSPLQRSVIYDDWGRKNTLEFALENGDYDVTVSVGWAGRQGSYRHHRVIVEGVEVISPGLTEPDGYRVSTARVQLTDGSLTFEAGGVVAEGDYQYTMLNYAEIVPTG